MSGSAVRGVPAPPRHPSPRARALLFRLPPGAFVLALVGAIFTGVGAIFATIFCWGLPTDVALDANGVLTLAELERVTVDERVRVNNQPLRRLTVSFMLDGEAHQAELSLADPQRVAELERAGVIELEVLPSDPSRARLRGETYALFGWGGAATLVMPIGGLALLVVGWRSRRRLVHAFTHGRPTPGRVVARDQDLQVRINRRHPHRVRWEFALGREVYRGSLSAMERATLDAAAPSDEVVVLYDPADPRCNTLWLP